MQKTFLEKVLIGFNPKRLEEVAFQSLRENIKHLILLLFFLSLILSIGNSVLFVKGLRQLAREAPNFFGTFKDFPEITIKDGELVSPQEYYINGTEHGGIIIDSGGLLSHYLGDPIYGKYVIILKDKVIIPESEFENRVYDLSNIDYFDFSLGDEKEFMRLSFNDWSFSLTLEKISRWTKIICLVFPPLALIFTFLFLLIGKGIQILLFSVLSLIVNSAGKAGLGYKGLLNIGIFALTVPLILETLVKLIPFSIPYFNLAYVSIYIVFLIVGILECKDKKTIEARA